MFAPLPAGEADARARWLRVRADGPDAARGLAARLAADPAVEQAFVEPEISLPVIDARLSAAAPRGGESCPITTPSFESYQGYLGPAPHGIDAPAAWRRGHRGAGVWFADIEGGWNAAHEDLPGSRITHVGGRSMDEPSWRAHGTAVLGEVVGRDNGKGVVGIAPDVERVFTSSIDGQSVAGAIDAAARELRPGDVLLIELQGVGPRGRYLPVEHWDDVFDAIKAATDRGVVVIEAAGNGGEDLDHRAYGGKFDRARRDSGAIMVGAGGPPRRGFTDRARLDFSNYGGRVDVQGWGRKVATLDYGDLQACAGPERERHYTGEFSGTSSASPIVAGAAVLLQGIARESGAVLAPAALRRLLRETGTPQAGDTRRAIGPRPDLEQAIRELPRY
jgi:subtilisin family serine protease